MSNAPQCPSTAGHEPANPGSAITGRAYWSSLDELSQTPEFREFAEREFPAFASEMLGSNRRTFLKLMGASIALAGAAASVPGCRRPDHRILAYSKDPEHVIPGRPLYIASAMHLPGGGCEGLLVETHTGRPTKIEGNPLHPINMGATSVAAQASVLNLYDPDRVPGVTRRGDGLDEHGRPVRVPSSWEEFDQYVAGSFRRFDANNSNGSGLFFLVSKASSPARDAMRSRVLARWPQASWLPYEAVDDESGRDGSAIAFGAPQSRRYALDKARVIVALGADILGEDGTIPDTRGFAVGRRVDEQSRLSMNRLYSIESDLTLTGAAADHRLRAKPSEVERLALRLCAETLRRMNAGGQLASNADRKGEGELYDGDAHRNELAGEWVAEAAKDLAAAHGACVIIGGPCLSAPTRALIDATNEALGANGKTVFLSEMLGDERESSLRSITRLAEAIRSRQVGSLVVLGANPVYDAPADLGFAGLFASVPITIVCNESENETSLHAVWSCNRAHALESWGDARADDGTLTVIQPMTRPLFEGRSDLEFLAHVTGGEVTDGYELVKATWTAGPLASAANPEKAWKRALHDGVFFPSRSAAAPPRVNAGAVTQELSSWSPSPTAELEVVFKPCAKVFDGRGANNGWLLELPDPITKITWDNPALISPTTAKALGIRDLQKGLKEHSGQKVTLKVGGRSVEMPVWISPGVADGTVVLTLGYGRTHAGRIGDGVGFDVYPLRATDTMRRGVAELTPAGGSVEIACVQDHWSLEGRTYYREADFGMYEQRHGEVQHVQDAYGRKKDLNFAQRLGEESHTPTNETIYQENQRHSYTTGPQWGMAIDMNACTGCAACTIACQAENNIPVVGKSQVLNGREMHWIRVDRYYADRPFTGAEHGGADSRGMGDVDVAIQPVTCMQCENAPCETVCPVNATSHGPAGTNDMVYNRCIGTRYCANNCPYKVRRFNFFDYATKRLNGDYAGKEILGGVVKEGHLIPPRLREHIEHGSGAIQIMQYNPDVTVRSRGVMEKCTYCIQRVNWARTEAKLEGVWGGAPDKPAMPDGYVKTACQQVCAANAIVFGDTLDPNSAVAKAKKSARNYGMLDYLNVLPRTTYGIRLRNPNPAITRPAVLDPFEHHGGGHDAGGASHEATRDEGHVMSLPMFGDNQGKDHAGARASGSAELFHRIETGIESMITSAGGLA
jgi:molybdopterin-containing oxidoreductase family iron-sulfur binding subunit